MSRMLTFDEREERIRQLKAEYASGKLDQNHIPELVDLIGQMQTAQEHQIVVIDRYAGMTGTDVDVVRARTREGCS